MKNIHEIFELITDDKNAKEINKALPVTLLTNVGGLIKNCSNFDTACEFFARRLRNYIHAEN